MLHQEGREHRSGVADASLRRRREEEVEEEEEEGARKNECEGAGPCTERGPTGSRPDIGASHQPSTLKPMLENHDRQLSPVSVSPGMSQKFPQVQGGGSLIVAWQTRDKHVLVVGGGEVAAGRILHALNADARVTVVCPQTGLNEEVAYRVAQKQVSHIDRTFEPQDLDGADMVLCAIDDPEASTQVWKLCKERRIPANIADVPSECDFFFGSVHRDGPLQVMVSTNGNGPKLASIVRKKIANALPENTGAAIENVGRLRKKLRTVAPNAEEGPKRMKWMSTVCESWSLEDLVEMTEKDMDALLSFYQPNKVPSLQDLRH